MTSTLTMLDYATRFTACHDRKCRNRMMNNEGSSNDPMTESDSGFVILSSFVLRHFNWRFLNFVCMLCKLIAKHACEINVVHNDHVGVVFFVIVVLPAFIPPTETDHAWPSACK